MMKSTILGGTYSILNDDIASFYTEDWNKKWEKMCIVLTSYMNMHNNLAKLKRCTYCLKNMIMYYTGKLEFYIEFYWI